MILESSTYLNDGIDPPSAASTSRLQAPEPADARADTLTFLGRWEKASVHLIVLGQIRGLTSDSARFNPAASQVEGKPLHFVKERSCARCHVSKDVRISRLCWQAILRAPALAHVRDGYEVA